MQSIRDPPRRVTAIVGHPDDEVIMCGGTLARLKYEGWEVTVAYLTKSDQAFFKGPKSERQQRAVVEANNAGSILGVDHQLFYDLEDMYLGESPGTLIRTCIEIIRKTKPHLIITHNEEGRHTDHRAVGKYVPEANWQASREVCGDCGQEQWMANQIWKGEVDLEGFNNINPEVVVDITEFVDAKLDALMTYMSLSGEHNKLFEAGNLADYVISNGRLKGLAGEVKYGEGFIVDKTIPMKVFKQNEEVKLWL